MGVTYKTAWRMANLIRKYMGWVDGDAPLGGPGGGIVEADEVQIGGYAPRGTNNKTMVMGVVERGGEIVTRVIPAPWRRQRGHWASSLSICAARFPASPPITPAPSAICPRYGYRHGSVDHVAWRIRPRLGPHQHARRLLVVVPARHRQHPRSCLCASICNSTSASSSFASIFGGYMFIIGTHREHR